jgi:hypothetical protein
VGCAFTEAGGMVDPLMAAEGKSFVSVVWAV